MISGAVLPRGRARFGALRRVCALPGGAMLFNINTYILLRYVKLSMKQIENVLSNIFTMSTSAWAGLSLSSAIRVNRSACVALLQK